MGEVQNEGITEATEEKGSLAALNVSIDTSATRSDQFPQ
jgi:hypothetical protein